jgi:hypothetical protein
MPKTLDKEIGQAELAPVSPKEELVTFVSEDEQLALVLEPMKLTAGVDGQPVRHEPIIMYFKEWLLRVNSSDTVTIKSQGTKPVNLVELLRAHPKYDISFREATDASLTSKGDASDTLDEIEKLSTEQLRTQCVKFGYNPLSSDDRNKMILEIIRRK